MAATIAMMVGGAVLNATTFVSGNYLAKYLSSGSESSAFLEKDKVVLSNSNNIVY